MKKSQINKKGAEVDLTGVDPHVCAGLLKQYLRELPEPLLTFEYYDCFLAAVGKSKIFKKKLKLII